jgi:hypothetical protein
MKKIFLSIPLFLLTGLITGCTSTTSLEPGAENVKLISGTSPKDCQLRGNVNVSKTDIYVHRINLFKSSSSIS